MYKKEEDDHEVVIDSEEFESEDENNETKNQTMEFSLFQALSSGRGCLSKTKKSNVLQNVQEPNKAI